MKQGDTVLVWGASGGLGSYATQMVLNGGGTPVCVVFGKGAGLLEDGRRADHRPKRRRL
jgi:NADPH:quinone reductase-like Zn-dependent oxidoreductase